MPQIHQRKKTIAMRIIKAFIILAFIAWAQNANAQSHEHGGGIFHAITLEAAANQSKNANNNSIDLDGWIGGDFNKLWLKGEGEFDGASFEHGELIALYSKNIATFWDLQIGLRHDFATKAEKSNNYLALGFNGLAPYFFETEAHMFVGENGNLSARFHQSNEILITNRLITEPNLEIAFGQDQKSSLELGLQTRYEFSRKIAPFVEANYLARSGRIEKSEKSIALGVRFLF